MQIQNNTPKDIWLDLSHPLHPETPVWPGDPKLTLQSTTTLAKEGWNNEIISLGAHTGTHLDAPGHFFEEGNSITDVSPELFQGKAICLDCRKQAESGVIEFTEQQKEQISEDFIVLICTRWDRHWSEDHFFTDFPVLHKSSVEFLLKMEIKMLGMDTPGPDQMPFPLHKKLLQEGIPLLENLRGIHRLIGVPELELFAFPLPIPTSGIPVRAMARIVRQQLL